MGDLFSGLEEFGLDKLKGMDVYKKEESLDHASGKKEPPKFVESDYLFDKTHTCPVCDNTFKSKMVRTGRVKLLSVDSDLRPKYQSVDSLKYDAILCNKCGYAALSRFFSYMTVTQAKLIKAKISTSFKANETPVTVYTYDEAIKRHKLALLSTIVSNGKLSERAYICLKIGWLYRGKRETLPKTTKDFVKVQVELKQQEDDFLLKAYEGFYSAIMKETSYPMCGMDEYTVWYLIAELARRAKKYEEALRLVSKIIVARDANERIKSKARIIKDEIKKSQQTEPTPKS